MCSHSRASSARAQARSARSGNSLRLRAGPPPEPAGVGFVRWEKGIAQGAAPSPAGALSVPLPIPFALPPTRYQAGDQPWATDVPWPGLDSWGRTIFNPHGCHYGVLEQQDWADIID